MKDSIRLAYLRDGIEIGRLQLNLYDHEIVDVVIDPENRRKGIASCLVTCAEVIAKELKLPRVFATVDTNNSPSNGLWLKMGYGDPFFKFEKKLS